MRPLKVSVGPRVTRSSVPVDLLLQPDKSEIFSIRICVPLDSVAIRLILSSAGESPCVYGEH